MYSVTTEIRFTASHFLVLANNHKEDVHEHTWKLSATVEAGELDSFGLVVDFHLLQKILKRAVEPLSRVTCINELEAFQNQNPSSELLARYIYNGVALTLPGTVRLVEIVLWETEDCRACYRP
jgi:6-pyruvoyltetrahydropterin/6-carboxytetrahydropterin synthase